ncbi:4-(cytidine 5'-diphospho)-2-C-methyl-D-erythritol kinase [Desulfopila sp. IMCC35008]|uniref:4-(cytidine 5'-diphospho)-2-C-methyl-D-erythritol kinase n=1 Tax=Desulfopila sp. IMCC35008 TaxID=2653858 RepID=UPI0013D72D56|nr:4-(cytidine 5'-diphospho)-2-C-methyl-D-erythritol kinase [Desulfopila sp. IMCC35008]
MDVVDDKGGLTLWAPAKINLNLHVVGRRADGYHELETWMQKLALYDEICLQPTTAAGIQLACSTLGVPSDHTNLAWKAADVFLKNSSRFGHHGIRIHLKKNIPAAAGLGGGSSDAGTVLRGLNRLCDFEFSEQQMVDMARSLGADVPLFAVEHSAVLARGVGDIMEPVPSLDNYTYILVNPDFEVSTKWVFETFALTRQNENSILAGFRKDESPSLSLKNMHNDLERITSGKFPEIEQMKGRLLKAGASAAMMSGSGPTVFGLFPDADSEEIDLPAVAESIRREYCYKVFVVRASVGAWPSGEGTGF